MKYRKCNHLTRKLSTKLAKSQTQTKSRALTRQSIGGIATAPFKGSSKGAFGSVCPKKEEV
jgi:hypothetical protein